MIKHIKKIIYAISLFAVFHLTAQNKAHINPQYEPYYFNSAVQGSQIYYETSKPAVIKEDPMLTSQRQAWQAMGYNPPVIPPIDPIKLNEFLANQYKAESASSETNRDKHLLETMNELHYTNYSNKVNNSSILTNYQNAFSTINDMLTGKTKLSFINAVYASERAFGNPYLKYDEYKAIIQQSANFIKQWLKQQNAPLTSDNLHYAIQQFMGDDMNIKVLTDDKKNIKIITHEPFKYDYVDYDGKTDYRNYFATKCFATGTGQCSSMPDVYLLLCEALEIKGYKTFAPFHSYVKYKTSKGTIENYEPTSHWILPDKWYQDHLGVTSKAKSKCIYLDTLNKKQCVANALVDLAISYMVNHAHPDTAFIQKCLTASNRYFPKGNNLYSYLAKSSLIQRQLLIALKQHGIKDLSEVSNYSDTSSLYKQLMENEEHLANMGYQEMPKELYEDMLKHQTNKTNNPDSKIKKSLFKTK